MKVDSALFFTSFKRVWCFIGIIGSKKIKAVFLLMEGCGCYSF